MRVPDCEHLFDRGEPDWGFTSYMPLREIENLENGFVGPDGSLTVDCKVTVTPHREDDDIDSEDLEKIDRVRAPCPHQIVSLCVCG
jgi:hypothetical protein